MKSIVIKEFCDTLIQVHVSSTDRPRHEPRSLLIQVKACGVNFVDTLYARGKHQNNKALVLPPFTLGLEFAGIVVSAPPTSTFRQGDTVFGDLTGSFAEYVSVPADSALLRRMYPGWTFVECAGLAATLPVSYDSLVRRANLKPGETVLVHSAAGGLGIMAVQIAVAIGCTVIGTAGAADKCTYVQSFGAQTCFDYTRDEWHKQVLKATQGRGVDVVFDPVGLIGMSLKCIAQRGRLLVIGFAGREGQMEKVAMNHVLLKQVQLIGYRYGDTLRRKPQERERIWAGLEPLLLAGKIKPTVGRLYEGLESVPLALQDLADRKVVGKAVVDIQGTKSPRIDSRL